MNKLIHTEGREGFFQTRYNENKHARTVVIRQRSFSWSGVKIWLSLIRLWRVHQTEATLSSNKPRSHGNMRWRICWIDSRGAEVKKQGEINRRNVKITVQPILIKWERLYRMIWRVMRDYSTSITFLEKPNEENKRIIESNLFITNSKNKEEGTKTIPIISNTSNSKDGKT